MIGNGDPCNATLCGAPVGHDQYPCTAKKIHHFFIGDIAIVDLHVSFNSQGPDQSSVFLHGFVKFTCDEKLTLHLGQHLGHGAQQHIEAFVFADDPKEKSDA